MPTFAVNVSAQELAEPGFVDHVMRALEESGLPANRLVIELVETSVHQAGNTGLIALEALRAAGVAIALDDFGTGFSSLGELASLPVSILKLDRAFVANMTTSTTHEALVEAIVRMGHALGHQVIAEGVEHIEQADRLRALGCDRAQGFLFGRPDDAAFIAESERGGNRRADRSA